MVSIMNASIGAVVGTIGVLVFAEVYAAINKTNIPTGAQSLLLVVPLVLAAVILVGIVMFIASR